MIFRGTMHNKKKVVSEKLSAIRKLFFISSLDMRVAQHLDEHI